MLRRSQAGAGKTSLRVWVERPKTKVLSNLVLRDTFISSRIHHIVAFEHIGLLLKLRMLSSLQLIVNHRTDRSSPMTPDVRQLIVRLGELILERLQASSAWTAGGSDS